MALAEWGYSACMDNRKGVVMEKSFNEIRSKGAVINQVVLAHHFSDPRYVVYDDPDYDATLLATPGEDASLLDVAAIMADLKEILGLNVMIVTPDEFESAGDGGEVIPLVGAA
jgi:hypothetical protein